MPVGAQPEIEIGQRLVVRLIARVSRRQHRGRHASRLVRHRDSAPPGDQAIGMLGHETQMHVNHGHGQRQALIQRHG
jgi:hypothetical protein